MEKNYEEKELYIKKINDEILKYQEAYNELKKARNDRHISFLSYTSLLSIILFTLINSNIDVDLVYNLLPIYIDLDVIAGLFFCINIPYLYKVLKIEIQTEGKEKRDLNYYKYRIKYLDNMLVEEKEKLNNKCNTHIDEVANKDNKNNINKEYIPNKLNYSKDNYRVKKLVRIKK